MLGQGGCRSDAIVAVLKAEPKVGLKTGLRAESKVGVRCLFVYYVVAVFSWGHGTMHKLLERALPVILRHLDRALGQGSRQGAWL